MQISATESTEKNIKITKSSEHSPDFTISREWRVAMAQIQFTITEEAAAYLRWYARTILFEKSDNANAAARHLMLSRMEQLRRETRHNEPSSDDLAVPQSVDGHDGGNKD
jgi:hypothetical protein